MKKEKWTCQNCGEGFDPHRPGSVGLLPGIGWCSKDCHISYEVRGMFESMQVEQRLGVPINSEIKDTSNHRSRQHLRRVLKGEP